MFNLKAELAGTKFSMWSDDVDNIETQRQILQDLGFEFSIEVLDEVEGE